MNNHEIRGYMYLMNSPIIIGLWGENNVGKSKMSIEICKQYDNSRTISLAYPAKVIASMFGYNDSMRKTDEKHRRLIKEVTRIGFEFNENIWLEQSISRINHEHLGLGVNLFIADDMRYQRMEEGLARKFPYLWYEVTERNRYTLLEQICKDIDNLIKTELLKTKAGKIICMNL